MGMGMGMAIAVDLAPDLSLGLPVSARSHCWPPWKTLFIYYLTIDWNCLSISVKTDQYEAPTVRAPKLLLSTVPERGNKRRRHTIIVGFHRASEGVLFGVLKCYACQ